MVDHLTIRKQKLPVYVCLVADPMSWEADALQHPWDHLKVYAFTLLTVIRVLNKILTSQCLTGSHKYNGFWTCYPSVFSFGSFSFSHTSGSFIKGWRLSSFIHGSYPSKQLQDRVFSKSCSKCSTLCQEVTCISVPVRVVNLLSLVSWQEYQFMHGH